MIQGKYLRYENLVGLALLFVLVLTSFRGRDILFTTQVLTAMTYVISAWGITKLISRYLIRTGFYNRSKKLFLVWSLTAVLFFTLLLTVLKWLVFQSDPALRTYPFWNISELLLGNFCVILFCSVLSSSVQIFRDQQQVQLQLESAQKDQVQTELKYLKSQMNPHFLFNSINSIYLLVDVSAEKAKECLVMFSNLLRYQLYECGADYLPAHKEVDYLVNYLELQKMRLNTDTDLDYRFENFHESELIAPLLLIILVENACKYVAETEDKRSYIRIRMFKDKNCFVFESENSAGVNRPIHQKGGLGLENLRRRLALLYPEAHELHINQKHQKFTVCLKIPIRYLSVVA